jgi:hypothetical protein
MRNIELYDGDLDNLKMFLMHNISDACADWFEGTVMTVIRGGSRISS